MIIYNVTIQVQADIHAEWLKWMRDVHAPDLLATGKFDSYRIMRLLDIDETEGPTYAVQYHAPSKAMYNEYISLFADEMRAKAFEKWGDKFIAFRTLMQIVN